MSALNLLGCRYSVPYTVSTAEHGTISTHTAKSHVVHVWRESLLGMLLYVFQISGHVSTIRNLASFATNDILTFPGGSHVGQHCYRTHALICPLTDMEVIALGVWYV